MSEKTFLVSFSGSTAMTVDEVWPDGDAPDEPTAADVVAVMRTCGPPIRMVDEWSLADYLEVWVDAEKLP